MYVISKSQIKQDIILKITLYSQITLYNIYYYLVSPKAEQVENVSHENSICFPTDSTKDQISQNLQRDLCHLNLPNWRNEPLPPMTNEI